MNRNPEALDLNEDHHAREVLETLYSLSPGESITFLLSDWPLQVQVGKLMFRANNRRDEYQGGIDLDIVNSDEGVLLYATCSLLEELDID